MNFLCRTAPSRAYFSAGICEKLPVSGGGWVVAAISVVTAIMIARTRYALSSPAGLPELNEDFATRSLVLLVAFVRARA
jgi:uncharacterized membrane protein YjjP (DUF1212 family)